MRNRFFDVLKLKDFSLLITTISHIVNVFLKILQLFSTI